LSAPTLFAAAVLALVACASLTFPWPRVRNRLPILALAWLSIVAVESRWAFLQAQSAIPLWPDSASMVRLSLAMTHPFDTGFREPFWPWIAWVFQQLFGPGPTAMRLMSFVASVLIVPAAYLFGRDYGRSRLAGLIAAGVISVHGYLIESSAQGHRTELLILGITAVTYFGLVDGIRRRNRIIGLTVSGSTLLLTSLTTMVVVLPVTLRACYKQHMRVRDLLPILAVMSIVITPHIAYNYQKFGTYSYFSTQRVPIFYRNYEFMAVRRTGCAGCPSDQEYRASRFSGQPISMGDYLFKLHTPAEVAARTFDGFVISFLRRGRELDALMGGSSWIQYVLYLLGSFIALTTYRREVLAVMILTLNLTAFVVPLGGIDVRLLTGPVVIAALLQAVPITVAAGWFATRWKTIGVRLMSTT
jgi:4-amino-4-deoxy-L-arabinose transferase-like glycosyltransferase